MRGGRVTCVCMTRVRARRPDSRSSITLLQSYPHPCLPPARGKVSLCLHYVGGGSVGQLRPANPDADLSPGWAKATCSLRLAGGGSGWLCGGTTSPTARTGDRRSGSNRP
jgi:hypothetical protein